MMIPRAASTASKRTADRAQLEQRLPVILVRRRGERTDGIVHDRRHRRRACSTRGQRRGRGTGCSARARLACRGAPKWSLQRRAGGMYSSEALGLDGHGKELVVPVGQPRHGHHALFGKLKRMKDVVGRSQRRVERVSHFFGHGASGNGIVVGLDDGSHLLGLVEGTCHKTALQIWTGTGRSHRRRRRAKPKKHLTMRPSRSYRGIMQ